MSLAACGSSTNSTPPATSTPSSTATATAQATTPTSTIPVNPPLVAELPAAERPQASEFPAAAGRTLVKLARLVKQTASLGPANGIFTPGRQRFAFALTGKGSRYIYAPTALYVASTPSSHAVGPFVAPADPMGVPPQYRSQQNSAPGGLEAIYSSQVPLPRSGVFDVLALSRVGGKLIGSTGEIAVALNTPIPSVGQKPPDIATDTLATVHGDVGLLTTRVPPESMHSVSFNQIFRKRPVALLFSTPELCTSRVCGPVTDIMVELQHEFANRITFIHEEVYVDNQPSKGLRPQLKAFHLETEPWLFTVTRQGRIAARLQGAFGINEARAALEAAIRR